MILKMQKKLMLFMKISRYNSVKMIMVSMIKKMNIQKMKCTKVLYMMN